MAEVFALGLRRCIYVYNGSGSIEQPIRIAQFKQKAISEETGLNQNLIKKSEW